MNSLLPGKSLKYWVQVKGSKYALVQEVSDEDEDESVWLHILFFSSCL